MCKPIYFIYMYIYNIYFFSVLWGDHVHMCGSHKATCGNRCLLSPCGFWGLNSGSQAWHPALPLTEPVITRDLLCLLRWGVVVSLSWY